MAECQDYRRRHDNLVRRHKVLIDELSAARNHSRKRARRRRDSDTDHGNRGRDPRSAEPPVWRPRRVRSEDLEVLSQQQAVGEEVTGDAGPVIPQINVSPAPAPPPRQESDRVPVSRAVLSAVESVRPHGNRDLDHTTRGAILRPCQSRSPSPLDLGLSDWIRLESDLANDITIPPPPPPSESDGNHHEAGCSCRGQAQRHAANEPGALRAEADDAVRAAGGQRRFPLVNHALEEYLVLN
ncbi:hypothetical protein B0T22DRAFT_472100 [Podospora appendiculata]|uniref:Uncharacterized protein n=1 Tax=Podospora appendiculata TaxID=314037 RepID=A0AAE1C8I9_9PEZI|nr:hypothetical protein B0T22DRAFT_472100 [Podospora appendiculata]